MLSEIEMLNRQIETPRLILVLPELWHLEAYVAYCASDRAQFVGGPFSAAKAFEKLCAMAGHWTLRGFGRYVITLKNGGQAIGHVGALQVDHTELPEMTWSLWVDSAEGQGYAFEAAQSYLAQANEFVGARDMLIRIAAENTRSHNLARRLGAVVDDQTPAPPWLPNATTYRLEVQSRSAADFRD